MSVVGNIYSIIDPCGDAFYIQVTHKNKIYGELVGVFDARGFEFEGSKNLHEMRLLGRVFFPASAACRRGIISYLGKAAIDQRVLQFPNFKNPQFNPRTGELAAWWIWDGEKTWKWEGPVSEIDNLPAEQIVNDNGLLMLIDQWKEG